MFLLKAGTYTFQQSETIQNVSSILVEYIEGGSNLVIKEIGIDLYSSITIDHDCIVYFYNKITSGVTFSNKKYYVWLVEGSNPSTFEPYSGSTTEYEFPQEAGTVHGGSLTIHQDGTGELVVDHAFLTDDGSLNWIRNNDGSFYVANPGSAAVQDADGCACNYAPFVLGFDGLKVFFRSNGLISLGNGWGNVFATADALKAAFASVPIQFVYKLATPIVYELTNQQVISLLHGANNVWADTGSVSLEYPADTKLYIDKRIAELQALVLENISNS